MDILVAHNYYQQPGGEDQCVAAEVAMLRSYGHNVVLYSLHNDAVDTMGRFEVAARAVWNRDSSEALRTLFRSHRPQIVHFHNTFPLISPSAYYAAKSENVRVVQTLHNFRLLCGNALLFRDGAVCEECVGKSLGWPGIVHGCYRKSRAASGVVAAVQTAHRALGTWRNAVDIYIALSESSRLKLAAGGLPADRIVTKPNFAYPDPQPGTGSGGYALFVGRLSEEKGIETLLAAWRSLGGCIPLKIVGDGPEAPIVQRAAAEDDTIEWLGRLPSEAVYSLVGDAAFLVLPSRCYENFPLVIIEAYAKATPVIASRLGAMAEIVDDGRTGLLLDPGNPADLAEKARMMLMDPKRLAGMRKAARQEFVSRYTAEANHEALMAIYQRALGSVPVQGDERRHVSLAVGQTDGT